MRYTLYSFTEDKIDIDKSMSIDAIDTLLSISEDNINFISTTYGILPEIECGDIVMNKNTKDIGEVYNVDKSIKYINDVEELENICGYISIINSNNEIIMWRVSDLIVINNSTID